jgi:hypothetical protein
MCRGLRSFGAALGVADFLHDGGVAVAAEACSSLSVEVCNMHDDGTQILPFLWLSSYTLSLQPKQLLRMGITHIIDCRSTPFDVVSKEGLKFLCLPIEDEVECDHNCIKQDLLSSFNYIEDSRRSGGGTLIHCSAGTVLFSKVTTVLYVLFISRFPADLYALCSHCRYEPLCHSRAGVLDARGRHAPARCSPVCAREESAVLP